MSKITTTFGKAKIGQKIRIKRDKEFIEDFITNKDGPNKNHIYMISINENVWYGFGERLIEIIES